MAIGFRLDLLRVDYGRPGETRKKALCTFRIEGAGASVEVPISVDYSSGQETAVVGKAREQLLQFSRLLLDEAERLAKHPES